MYAIRKTRRFYGPRVERSYVTDGFDAHPNKRAEFKHRREAEAVAAMLDGARYDLAHGEYARAEYRVVRI